MRPTDRPWGAALLEDGTRWTLLDRWTLALFSRDGRITSRHPLARPHIGLYGLGTRLLYQAFESDARRVGVSLGEPGNLHRQLLPIAASRLTTDAATTRLRNLLACGTTVWPVLPCWLPYDNYVRLVRETTAIDVLPFDATRIRTRLGGNTTSLRLAIRDASIDQAHHIWVLWDVVNPAGGDSIGALSRSTPEGQVQEAVVLRDGARLILGASPSVCYVLRGDGAIARVVRS